MISDWHITALQATTFLKGALGPAIESLLLRNERDSAVKSYQLLKALHDGAPGAVEEAHKYQVECLRSVIRTAQKHSRFYARILRSFDCRDEFKLECLPFLTKEVVKSKLQDIRVRPTPVLNSLKFNTGGSTGVPMEFFTSRTCGLVDRFHQLFCFELAGYQKGDRIFACDGSVVPVSQRERGIFWIRKNAREIPYGSYHLSSHYFSEDTAHYYLDFIRKKQPDFLRGYPSFISALAKHVASGTAKGTRFLKGIQLTAETVFDWQVQTIGNAFGCPVSRQYGHSEMSVFGFTIDRSGQYFCSPVYGVVEVIGQNDRHVKSGQMGEVVVTSLHNSVCPFIRYRTGDLAIYGGVSNGFPVLSEIVGRTQDYVYDRENRAIPVTGLVFGQHFKAFGNIKSWQILQEVPGKISVRVVPGPGFSDEDVAEIRARFQNNCSVDVTVQPVESLPLTGRGKVRFVVSKITPAPGTTELN